MKKIVCIILSIIMIMGLVACGTTPTQAPTEKETIPTQTPNTEPPATEPVTEEIPIDSTEIEIEINTALTGTIETTPTESLDMVFTYTVYTPNENADGFIEEVIETNVVNPESVLAELQKRNVLPEDVVVNSCSIDDGLVNIDFNQAFADVVCATGTSGELMVVGSVVNTYLSAFGTDSLYFTVDGEVLESGHTVYDFVMSYYLSEDA